MKVSKAIDLYLDYHRLNSQKNTTRTLWVDLVKVRDQFSDRGPESISPDEVLSFLVGLNDGCKQLTKHTRYSYLKAFFQLRPQ